MTTMKSAIAPRDGKKKKKKKKIPLIRKYMPTGAMAAFVSGIKEISQKIIEGSK